MSRFGKTVPRLWSRADSHFMMKCTARPSLGMTEWGACHHPPIPLRWLAQSLSMEHIFTDANFDEEVLKNAKSVLVDFWAVWCGPCRMMSPLVEELAGEMEGKLVVGKMNVDEHPQTPMKYSILSIPTFILFQNGQVVETIVGSLSKEDLKERLLKHLS